jgi:hypothetical protein
MLLCNHDAYEISRNEFITAPAEFLTLVCESRSSRESRKLR